MKLFSTFIAALMVVGLGVAAPEAEAKRLGGGSSIGTSRDLSSSKSTTTTTSQQAPTSAAAATSPAAAAAAQPAKRSWLGPVAGIAAAVGLAALASHLGMGEAFGSFLMIALMVMAVIAVVGFIMRRRAAGPQLAAAGAGAMGGGSMQYAGHQPSAPAAMPMGGAAPAAAAASGLPADCDAPAFERQARANFIRLQAANDAGDLEDLRAFTTPEMFGELKLALMERGAAEQKTDVVELQARVLDVAEEGNRYVVSVHFTGLLREDRDGPVEAVSEVWHLVKPVQGDAGWLLAGIQQMQ